MTLTLIQKLLMSIATLTSFYLLYTIALYRDLTRKISKSIFQFIPGILMFALGIAISRILGNPTLLFQTILPLKSGFAKGVLSTTVFPFIATSVRTLSIIAGLTALIDKCWFFWRSSRINYLFRLISVISMTIIAGNTVFKMIFADQKNLIEATQQLVVMSYGIGAFLGCIFIIVAILAMPHIFEKQTPQ
jgi:hypothetical protein